MTVKCVRCGWETDNPTTMFVYRREEKFCPECTAFIQWSNQLVFNAHKENKESNQGEENPMANKEQIKNKIQEAMQEGVLVISSLLEASADNPELKELFIKLGKEYSDVLTPTIQEFASAMIDARAEAFLKFKRMGLSDELAVKMACGR